MTLCVALFATIMSGVAGMLYATSQAQREARLQARLDSVAARVLRQLGRDFSELLPPLEEGRYHDPGFAGHDEASTDDEPADRLELVCTAMRLDLRLDWTAGTLSADEAPRARRSDIARVEYRLQLDATAGPVGLYRRVMTLLTSVASDEADPWVEQRLAAEVSAFTLRYLDPDGNLFDAWQLADHEQALPRQVEVELELDLVPEREASERQRLRELELAEGLRTPGRARYYRRYVIPVAGLPDLTEAVMAGVAPQAQGGDAAQNSAAPPSGGASGGR
jgi:type II secretory pathway component PulJ